MNSQELVSYLDVFLNTHKYPDPSNNGLQVQGAPEVARVAFAVDASLATFEEAVRRQAQLLIVHHGLFWSQHLQITGAHFARVKLLLDNGLGLYVCHIPLDAHPEVGNNIALARVAGLTNIRPWGTYKKDTIGFIGELPQPLPVRDLNARIEAAIGVGNRVQGDGVARVVAICSGFGVTLLDEVAAAGADTLVTGETSHQWYHPVRESNINVIYGGHYNTETVGLQALEAHLAGKFGLKTTFVAHPTGM